MIMKPVGERLIIKPIKLEEKTASGIILSGVVEKEKPNLGEIIAIGKSEKLEELKVGEKIVYAQYAGVEIKDGVDKYIILNLEDVLAIIEE